MLILADHLTVQSPLPTFATFDIFGTSESNARELTVRVGPVECRWAVRAGRLGAVWQRRVYAVTLASSDSNRAPPVTGPRPVC